jgi:RNA polymerase sigma factor (sigma-70 family)
LEASAIQAGVGLGRPRIALGSPLLRLRSDQQLIALFRDGNEDAFRVIHDRYRPRLLAYMGHMLPGRSADAEDMLQDVFLRTYAELRTNDRELALRPWLYRVAHNRCVDELRQALPVAEQLEARDHPSGSDPVATMEQREALRRVLIDIGRLPEQQRSALLMRELSGMPYADVAAALGTSVPAIKSLLVRARIGLAQALEARDAACAQIRRELAEAYDQGVRPSWMARRHLRDCPDCRACRVEMRATKRQVAALVPTLGPFAALAKLLGVGSGAGGGSATAAGAGTVGAGGAAAGTALTAGATTGLGITVGHVATILAAAVVTAGSAVAVQQTVVSHAAHHPTRAAKHFSPAAAAAAPLRVPAKASAATPSGGGPQTSQRHQAAGASGSADSSASSNTVLPAARRSHIPQLPAATPTDMAAASATNAASLTCTPPPPTACTASDTTTCPTSSGSTTSTTTNTTTGTTSTGSGTTGSGTSESGSTNTGTTAGTPATSSGTTSGTTGTTAVAACSSTTTQNTATDGTGTPANGTGSTTAAGSGDTSPKA